MKKDKNSFIAINNRILARSIKKIYVKDKIISAFLKLVFLTGARANEIQSLKLKDIKKHNDNFYSVFIKLSKKREKNVIREVRIDKNLYKEIQEAHKEYFQNKDFNYLHRTYLFQKTRYKKISVNTISNTFKRELEKIIKKKVNKSLHIFRHNYIKNMKENGHNVYDIMTDLGFSDMRFVLRVYGYIFVDKQKNFNIMNNLLKD